MKSIKIIVAAHKKYQMPNDKMYIPVQVGTEGKEKIERYQPDNVGENISKKNPYFCELTGLYWAWKNMDAVLRQEPCSITWLTIYMMANPDLEVRFLQPLKIC